MPFENVKIVAIWPRDIDTHKAKSPRIRIIERKKWTVLIALANFKRIAQFDWKGRYCISRL